MPGELVNHYCEMMVKKSGMTQDVSSEEYPAEIGKWEHIVPGIGDISSGIFSAILIALFQKKTLGMGQCNSKNKGTQGLFSVDLVHLAEQIQGREGKPPARENI